MVHQLDRPLNIPLLSFKSQPATTGGLNNIHQDVSIFTDEKESVSHIDLF